MGKNQNSLIQLLKNHQVKQEKSQSTRSKFRLNATTASIVLNDVRIKCSKMRQNQV